MEHFFVIIVECYLHFGVFVYEISGIILLPGPLLAKYEVKSLIHKKGQFVRSQRFQKLWLQY